MLYLHRARNLSPTHARSPPLGVQSWQQRLKAGPSIDPQVFGLTEREYQVLTLIVEGLSDKEIAVPLGISRFTVNKHVRAVMCKMEASSRTEAAVRAIRIGLVS